MRVAHEVFAIEFGQGIGLSLLHSCTLHDDHWRQRAKEALDDHGLAARKRREGLLYEAASLRGEGDDGAFSAHGVIAKHSDVLIEALPNAHDSASRRHPDVLLTFRLNHGTLAWNIFALTAYMQTKSTPTPQPVVTYPALVGRLLVHRREELGLKQGALAEAIGLSQSAYSRLESGESVLNLSQLRNVCSRLGISPAQVLHAADQYEAQLRRQGVDVVAERPANPAAIAIGLGLLAALFLGAK